MVWAKTKVFVEWMTKNGVVVYIFLLFWKKIKNSTLVSIKDLAISYGQWSEGIEKPYLVFNQNLLAN